MYVYTFRFLWALFYTVIVETAVLFFSIKYLGLKVENKKILSTGIVANVATIPYVWFVFPVLLYQSNTMVFIVGELFAFIFEAFFYKSFINLRYRDALIISAVANLLSLITWKIFF